jgi:dolichyl-phosphate beta-glucosyltransferase
MLIFLFVKLYAALLYWSPPLIVTRESEKKYLSHVSPTKPLLLHRLEDPSTVDLTIVIPAFNETERLPEMMAATIKHLTTTTTTTISTTVFAGGLKGKKQKKERSFEILIIDDGSRDGTSSTGLQLAHKYPTCDIKVITLEKNVGKGGAVRHGMLYGGGERLLMADADGASRIEDLEELWKKMDEIAPNNVPGVVVGSRAHLVKSEAVVKVCLKCFFSL